MSDWNCLELRKWTPRQPSPELRRRIFAEAGLEAVPRPAGPPTHEAPFWRLADLSRWLMPAVGSFLLVLASFSGHSALHTPVYFAGTNLVFPVDHSDINAVPARSLEWSFASNRTLVSPGLGSFLISYTNKLIQ